MRPDLALILIALASHTATAQRLPAVVVGDRIRIAPYSWYHPKIGTLRGIRSDTLDVAFGSEGEVAAIPIAQIRRLERSNGNRRFTKEGRWRGSLVGGAVGAVGGFVLCWRSSCNGGNAIPYPKAGATLIGFGTGGGIGSLVGMFWKTEQWTVLPRSTLSR